MIEILMSVKVSEESPVVQWKVVVMEAGDQNGVAWRSQGAQLKGWLGWQIVGFYDTCQFLDSAGRLNRRGHLRSIELVELSSD